MEGDEGAAAAARIRLVRCPKCDKFLPELPAYSVYVCGGCGAALQGAPPFSSLPRRVVPFRSQSVEFWGLFFFLFDRRLHS